MKIDWEGRAWEVDTAKVSLEQAVVITSRMGKSLAGWERTLAETEDLQWLEAIRCLYWLMLQQDGQQVPLHSVDFEVLQYAIAFGEAIERELPAAPAAPEDPTKPGGEPAAAASSPPGTDG